MWVEYKPPKKSSEPYDTGGAPVQPFTSLPTNVQEWLKGSGR